MSHSKRNDAGSLTACPPAGVRVRCPHSHQGAVLSLPPLAHTALVHWLTQLCWVTQSCWSTGSHSLACPLAHTVVLVHWLTQSCWSTGSHSHAGPLAHTVLPPLAHTALLVHWLTQLCCSTGSHSCAGPLAHTALLLQATKAHTTQTTHLLSHTSH